MKEMNRKNMGVRIAGGVVAVAVLTMGIAVNANQAFAKGVAAVPGMEGFVKVLTFGTYKNVSNGAMAVVETPKIEGLGDKVLEEKLNVRFKENADMVIKSFEQNIERIKKESGNKDIHLGVNAGYKVLSENGEYISINLYTETTQASSVTEDVYINIDKKNNKILNLSDMFKPGADYVDVLSKYIKSEIQKQMKDKTADYWVAGKDENAFEKIDANQKFYINEKGQIVIHFDEYSIAPGSEGAPNFVIPTVLTATLK